MKDNVAKENGIHGTEKVGKPAPMEPPPFAATKEATVSVSIPPNITRRETTAIPERAPGELIMLSVASITSFGSTKALRLAFRISSPTIFKRIGIKIRAV